MNGVTKSYDGVSALQGVTTTIEDREIHGFFGSDRTGKTTLLLVLAAIIPPTTGTVSVDGQDIAVDPGKLRKKLSISFKDPLLDPRLTLEQNLRFLAEICRLEPKTVDGIIDFFDLGALRRKKVTELNPATKKILENSKTFIRQTKYAVFDEPTFSLDPASRAKVWDKIRDLRNKGSTVIISSKNSEEIEALCDNVGLIKNGRLVLDGATKDLKALLPTKEFVEIIPMSSIDKARQILANQNDFSGPLTSDSNSVKLYFADAKTLVPIIAKSLLDGGVGIRSLQVKPTTFEDVISLKEANQIR